MGGWYVIMERCSGVTLDELSQPDWDVAVPLYKKELLKVLDFGIIPVDFECSNNGLYDVKSRRVTLIDLCFWRRGNAGEIQAYHRKIEEAQLYSGRIGDLLYG